MDNTQINVQGDAQAEALFNQSVQYIETRQFPKALEVLNQSLNLKATAPTHHRIGSVYFMMGQIENAERHFMLAIETDPEFHKSHASLAEIYRQSSRVDLAVEKWTTAIHIAPENIDYLNAFIFFAQHLNVHQYSPAVKNAFITALSNPQTKGIHFSGLTSLWLSLLETDPDAGIIPTVLALHPFDEFFKTFKDMDITIFNTPLFTIGLSKLVVPDMGFERGLTYLRHAFLKHQEALNNSSLPALCALADYGFETEYIFDITPSEQDGLNALKAEEDFHEDPINVALYGCYDFLYKLDEAEDIVNTCEGINGLIQKHIVKCLERKEISKNIPAITEISDGVSSFVRAQYEVFPYPRWNNVLSSYANEPLMQPFKNRPLDMLIAGCGTGAEAASIASGFPTSTVLAVDLSTASLSYGIQRSRELGIDNIDFRHGDILKLGTIDKKFDYVASSGVLHHMEDPMAGWRVITGLLKDDGIMRIALYSRKAREHIINIRNLIEKDEYENDLAGMRKFRSQARSILDEKAYDRITTVSDYYKASECRDLLFHVQEHQYDLPEIENALDELGLAFIKMSARPAVAQTLQQETGKNPEVASLQDWHEFEDLHPDSFIGMYQFWCKKK